MSYLLFRESPLKCGCQLALKRRQSNRKVVEVSVECHNNSIVAL